MLSKLVSYNSTVLCSPDFTVGSNEKKIRFCGPYFWHSCHDVRCAVTLICDIETLIYTKETNQKKVYQSLTLLTNFVRKAENNHFNNMIFIFSRKFRYIFFFKHSPVSMQDKLIKLWHKTGV